MNIEQIPLWAGAIVLFALYLVAVVNVGLFVEDSTRKTREGDLVPLRVRDREGR